MKNLPEKVLVDLVSNGDQRAFQELVSRVETRAQSYIFKYVNNKEDKQEVYQEVLLKAWEKLSSGKFENQSKFNSWFLVVCGTTSLDFIKKRKVRTAIAGNDFYQIPSPYLADSLVVSQDSEDEWQWVISQLSERQRQILLLRVEEGLKFKEISEEVGMKSTTCRTVMWQVQKRICEILGIPEKHPSDFKTRFT